MTCVSLIEVDQIGGLLQLGPSIIIKPLYSKIPQVLEKNTILSHEFRDMESPISNSCLFFVFFSLFLPLLSSKSQEAKSTIPRPTSLPVKYCTTQERDENPRTPPLDYNACIVSILSLVSYHRYTQVATTAAEKISCDNIHPRLSFISQLISRWVYRLYFYGPVSFGVREMRVGLGS